MFVITMAGLSNRFFKAGYSVPKYKLSIAGKSVFAWSVLSFKSYFTTETFVFVIRDVYDTRSFVEEELTALGVQNYRIVTLNEETRGQAETAYLGLKEIQEDEPVTIFNIDTFLRDYRKPGFVDDCDGYLEVFRGEGDHWSFVELDENGLATRTAEKERISDLCSDGLYYFRSKRQFEEIFLAAATAGDTQKGEFYIAPLYNRMIAAGQRVMADIIPIEEIAFCGTPDEYQKLIESGFPGAAQ